MFKRGKKLYWGLIITFFALYLAIAFVSTLHAITFFQLANTLGLAILLGAAYEIGQASVLFSILMTENKNRMLAWLMMFLLTALQVTANVYASFKFMDISGSLDWQFWQRAILFWLEADSAEMYKVIISWISGALLPLVALGMTALVADNIKLVTGEDSPIKEPEKEEIEKEDDPPLFGNLFKRKNIKDKSSEIDFDDDLDESSKEKEEIEKEDDLHLDFHGEKDAKRLEAIAKHLLDPVNQMKFPTETTSVGKVEKTIPADIPKLVGDFPKEPIIDIPDASFYPQAAEISENVVNTPNLKRGEKLEKIPLNHPRGWHLKKKFKDTNGDIYSYGKLIGKEEPPKKA